MSLMDRPMLDREEVVQFPWVHGYICRYRFRSLLHSLPRDTQKTLMVLMLYMSRPPREDGVALAGCCTRVDPQFLRASGVHARKYHVCFPVQR